MKKYVFGKNHWRTMEEGLEKEWLLSNGLGGFSNGTIIGDTSRIYGGYLIAAMNPPAERYVILSKIQERISFKDRTVDLACQQYVGDVKKGYEYLERFTLDVVPEFNYQVDDITIRKTIAIEYGKNTVTVCYEIKNGIEEMTFHATPLFSVRPFGRVSEKSELVFNKKICHRTLTMKKNNDENITVKFFASEGEYIDRSQFLSTMATPNYLIDENQFYAIDNRNGFLGLDNHYTPYDINLTLKPYEFKKFYFVCTVEADNIDKVDGFKIVKEYKEHIYTMMDQVKVQDDLGRKLAWAADSFIVKRNSTSLKTILAGFPWFSDWGRDTMIAFNGLTLCTGRFDDAKEILESFAMYIRRGLIPNMFPNSGSQQPFYNTIDASLWYFYAVDMYLDKVKSEDAIQFIYDKIYPKLKEIIMWYKKGTDFSIGMSEDGLIRGGSDLDQITWMDVRVGEWVVTPRHGKPVEVNALWYNALKVMEKLSQLYKEDETEYRLLADKVKVEFCDKFWNEEKGYLYDVVDPYEDRIRPNQLWAISLPYTMLDEDKEKSIVDICYKYLYTSFGMRSLSYTDEEYKKKYIGKLIQRDGSYHMGTTWSYLIGAFITAFCKVNHYSEEAVLRAKDMCELFLDHMEDGCINGIAEIFDGSFTCTSRGCFSQAWSVGELLRVYTEDVIPYLK